MTTGQPTLNQIQTNEELFSEGAEVTRQKSINNKHIFKSFVCLCVFCVRKRVISSVVMHNSVKPEQHLHRFSPYPMNQLDKAVESLPF